MIILKNIIISLGGGPSGREGGGGAPGAGGGGGKEFSGIDIGRHVLDAQTASEIRTVR
jgi:hypothetical protein